jgi:membrane protein
MTTRRIAGMQKAGIAGRGRSARTPSEIPPPGWKDVVVRVYEGISEDRIRSTRFSHWFPAALVSIYGLFADPGTIASHLDSISGVLPGGGVDVVRDQLTRLTAQGNGTLSISFVIGLVISLERERRY